MIAATICFGLTSIHAGCTTLLAQAGEPQPQSITPLLLSVVAVIVLYYFMLQRPERKKQAAYRAQLESLKKNDRVVTIGGIYGVVMNVQRETDEITLKIDEANNTKIRVTVASIARVLGGEATSDKPA